jgi:hypothetical protein
VLDRHKPTAVALAGAAMAVTASLVATALPAARAPIAFALGRSLIFMPVGALCALVVLWLRRGRALTTTLHVAFILVATSAGVLGIVFIDLAAALLRPDAFHGVPSSDLIVGVLTGVFGGHIGALKPMAKS